MPQLKVELGLASVRFISGVTTDEVVARRDEQPLEALASSELGKYRAAWRRERVGDAPFELTASKPRKPVEVAVFLALENKYGSAHPELFAAARERAQARDAARMVPGYFASPLRELVRLARRSGQAEIYADALFETHRLLRGKFGIELTFIDNEEIAHLKVRQVSSAAYFGFSRQGIPEELYPLVVASGVCAVVVTADNKLVVQFRDPKANAQYGGVFGASIAGMFDATNAVSDRALYDRAHGKLFQSPEERKASFDPCLHAPGIVDEIDDASVLQHLKREGREELGIREETDIREEPGSKNTLADLTVIGIAFDARMPHRELIGFAVVSQTSEELLDQSRQNHKDNASKYHFAEEALVIDASPEAIAALLSDIVSPLPPTHASAFLCAGTHMMRKREGDDAAARYFEAVSRRLQENYERVDSICRKATGTPYNPRVNPVDQGLPDPFSEARRVGLIR